MVTNASLKTMHKKHKSVITERYLLFIRYPQRNTQDLVQCSDYSSQHLRQYLQLILNSCHVQCEIKVTHFLII